MFLAPSQADQAGIITDSRRPDNDTAASDRWAAALHHVVAAYSGNRPTRLKKYRKITLHPDEVDFIKKMGGHVGIDVTLAEIRGEGLSRASEAAREKGKVFMIHPDDKGCLFLQKRNGKYYCKIYHYRPRTCRGFKCNLADNTFLDLFGQDSIHLLGQNAFGLPLG